ncbi:hypothetical protein DFJ77DRAFT_83532 [Powellomyces hirtus]|nr:hypothetical protein DFJ77DRAFT_83532 [Powellomyces hirtus]
MLPALADAPQQAIHRSSKSSSARNKTPSTPSESPVASREAVPITQTLCLELLRDGRVQSYIDFFRMTISHGPLSSSQQHADEGQLLHELKELLIAAEASQRRGDAKLGYESRKNIARYFQVQGNHELAIAYYREALDKARQIADDRGIEIEAARNIGLELERDGKPHEASDFYDTSRQLARACSNSDAEQLAAKSLVSVRMKLAKQQEKSKQYDAAIGQYNFCMQILLESCPDEQTMNDLNYRLGRAHQQIGNIPTAIEFLETFLLKVRKYGDRVKEGWAQAVLASCHESAGNLPLASEALLQFLSITESDPSQKAAQAQACNHLGNLYNRMGEYDTAVRYFERHYQLACGGGEGGEGRAPAADAAESTPRPPAGVGCQDGDAAEVVGEEAGSAAVPSATAGGLLEGTRAETDHDFKPTTTSTPMVRSTSAMGIAQVQLGISRANAHMEQFLDLVNDEKKLALLLKWKATHSFEVFEETAPA